MKELNEAIVVFIVHTGAVEGGGIWAKKFAVISSPCSLIYRHSSSLHSTGIVCGLGASHRVHCSTGTTRRCC